MRDAFVDGDAAPREKRDRTPPRQETVPVRRQDDDGARSKGVARGGAAYKTAPPDCF